MRTGNAAMASFFGEPGIASRALWGDGDEMPGFGWTGQRCNMDSVRNST